MGRFEDFAKRLHAVKEGIQEIAEIDFGKANSAYTTEVLALEKTIQTLNDAKREMTNTTRTAADLSAWSRYIVRLETLVKSQQEKITELGEMVEEKRSFVKAAYIDQKKWAQIVEQHAKKQVHAEMLGVQKQADESAVIRHGRSI